MRPSAGRSRGFRFRLFSSITPAVLYRLQSLFAWFGGESLDSRAMVDVTSVGRGEPGWIVLVFTLSMWLLSSALAGYERNRLVPVERVPRVVAGIAVLVPDTIVAAAGLAGAVALIAVHRLPAGEPSPVDLVSDRNA